MATFRKSNALLLIIAAFVFPSSAVLEFRTVKLSTNVELEYGVVEPDGFEKDAVYPVLLALPPGPQTFGMVQAGLDLFWRDKAEELGWVVVSPVTPDGALFHSGSLVHIEAFLRKIAEKYNVEGGKFHIAGPSNGGRSTFKIGLTLPESFHSLLALPGYPSDGDVDNLKNLKGVKVHLFVGGDDSGWLEKSIDADKNLRELGIDVSLDVFDGEGHLIPSLKGGELLFKALEEARKV